MTLLPAIKVIEDSLGIGSTWRAGVPVVVTLEVDGQNYPNGEQRHHGEEPNEVDLEAEVLDRIIASRGQYLLLGINKTTHELSQPSQHRSLCRVTTLGALGDSIFCLSPVLAEVSSQNFVARLPDDEEEDKQTKESQQIDD